MGGVRHSFEPQIRLLVKNPLHPHVDRALKCFPPTPAEGSMVSVRMQWGYYVKYDGIHYKIMGPIMKQWNPIITIYNLYVMGYNGITI